MSVFYVVPVELRGFFGITLIYVELFNVLLDRDLGQQSYQRGRGDRFVGWWWVWLGRWCGPHGSCA
jgi:hypothetical protein